MLPGYASKPDSYRDGPVTYPGICRLSKFLSPFP